ncbi:neuron-derived neurotrophic factor [Nesidiocoris tenuis]|uniref:Neuron-derived neurotrophic factor n=1 Tax=Nesidiocoris tenuis TaxID=355587 RepID=A0ABN7A664_9HEMI|nr:neuron-derived neurotrophic factor [Nesidiocoris tenuis]
MKPRLRRRLAGRAARQSIPPCRRQPPEDRARNRRTHRQHVAARDTCAVPAEGNAKPAAGIMQYLYPILAILSATTCNGDHQLAPEDAIRFARKSEMIGKMNLLNGEEMETHYITKGSPKMFVYLLQWDVPWLTITVTPCAVPVAWSVRNITSSGRKVDLNFNGWIPTTYELNARTFEQENATKGAYQIGVSVDVSGSAGGGYIQIFVSTAGPASLLRPTANLTLINRRHKGQISARWPPSTVDPHVVSYWLVVNPSVPTRALCQAKAMAGIDLSQPTDDDEDFYVSKSQLTIENLGSRTSNIIRGLKLGQNYSVEVFVVNSLTGLTYKYGSERAVRYARTRPLPLRDGRSAVANLRRLDGRATFRFKVPIGFTGRKLEWSVTVCGVGTVVDAEVRHRRQTVVPRREIVGYSTISFDDPTPGTTYILRINSTEPEMLARITQVQVLATMRGLQEPVLPKMTSLLEYKSSRSCRSVTLGWIPSSVLPTTNSSQDSSSTLDEQMAAGQYLLFPPARKQKGDHERSGTSETGAILRHSGGRSSGKFTSPILRENSSPNKTPGPLPTNKQLMKRDRKEIRTRAEPQLMISLALRKSNLQ